MDDDLYEELPTASNQAVVDVKPLFILIGIVLGVIVAIGAITLFLWWGGVWGLCTGFALLAGAYGCGRHFEAVHKYLLVQRIHQGGPKL